jgi:RNA polymerase sigma factor (TIGR02999 family)
MHQDHSDSKYHRASTEDKVVASMYADLGRIASHRLRTEPLAYLWSPASLISEAYLRVVRVYGNQWLSNGAPLALWSRVMSRVLIDHARAFRAGKRCWEKEEPYTEGADRVVHPDLDTSIAIATSLERLRRSDPRKASAIRLVVVCGLTIEEAARRLKVAPRTVKRVLHAAKDELRRELQ